jgi:glycosyltransferase involved in cell wall biosynthesis
MKLLMLSGDTALAQGRQGAFHQMLARFARHWERIDVICPRVPRAGPRQVHGNVYVHPSPHHKRLHLLHILRTGYQLLAQHRHDLIASHDYGIFCNGVGAWRLSSLTGVPYVSEILHIEGYPRSASLRHSLYRRLAPFYIRWAGRRAAAIRVMNRVEVPEALRKWGVPPYKVLVLPAIYIDFATFRPMPEPGKRYDVLFVGRLAPNKGILTIIAAVGQVKRVYPTIQLCILGDGALRHAVRKRVAALGLQKNVTLLDQVASADEVACLHNQSRMLVCASTAEGGPRVTIEAMACGVPVISTPVGLMRELIADGHNGMLFDGGAAELAHKITVLIEDESLRRKIGEAGRQSVQQGFQADQVVEQYARGYQELIRRLHTSCDR